ncbi:MAG: molybdate ABC transporter substrate-binding protein [Tissierellia bacterium]|nr:molybdate ABC transporter substrate-binding protein [Tissierellia bacterium]
MKRKAIIFTVISLLGITMLTACSKDREKIGNASPTDDSKDSVEISVAAAASLTDAINEIKDLYEDKHENIIIQPSYASSGALQTQIEEGAPVDIFLSAAEKQMDALEDKNLIDKDSRIPLLKNEVVLIAPIDGNAKIEDFKSLDNDDITKIAIADPASVPVGQYSEEIFTNLGNWDIVQSKMVISQDVRQSLDWVVQGEVDCGTVYKTDAYVEKDNINILASAPEGSHKPVIYPMAILKDSKDKVEVQEFYEFLSSDTALEIFENYGFVVNK